MTLLDALRKCEECQDPTRRAQLLKEITERVFTFDPFAVQENTPIEKGTPLLAQERSGDKETEQ